MKYRSVFDIIGPVMVGPSSSHTAGAVRIGRLARRLFGREPLEAEIGFFGSFARTWRGHATDVAVLAGILGLETSDPRIPDSYALAKEAGLRFTFTEEDAVPPHPNTVRVRLTNGADAITVTGISLGGGTVQIVRVDGFDLRLTGDAPALLIFHRDAYGAVAAVTGLLARERINISHMEVSRAERGRDALMVIETDQRVPEGTVALVGAQAHVHKIVVLSGEG
jgi:L-serine dehydratase